MKRRCFQWGCIMGILIMISLYVMFYNSKQIQEQDGSLIVKEVNVEELKQYVENKESFVFVLSKEKCIYCDKLLKMLKETKCTLKVDTLILNYTRNDRRKVLSELEEFLDNQISFPTIFITKDGKKIDDMVGYTDEETYWNFVYKYF